MRDEGCKRNRFEMRTGADDIADDRLQRSKDCRALRLG